MLELSILEAVESKSGRTVEFKRGVQEAINYEVETPEDILASASRQLLCVAKRAIVLYCFHTFTAAYLAF
jgi:hypothetical protein